MLRFFVKRLLYGIFVLFGVSVLIFVLARVIPGNPARAALGESATQEAVDALSEQMHLHEPIYVQYYYWITGVFQGNFGMSTVTMRDVSLDVKDSLGATMELVVAAGITQTLLAFLLGIFTAKNKDNMIDGTVRVASYVGIAVPGFVWGILLLLLFGHVWQIIPVLGRVSSKFAEPNTITGFFVIDYLLAGNFAAAWDAFLHLLLPTFSLAVGHMFQQARILRSSLIDNSSKEYITVHNSYGIPQNVILRKYLLKPSSTSVVMIAGIDFAVSVANAFLVEKIFKWPGLAKYCMDAMLAKDLNAMCATIIIIGVLFVFINMIVDFVLGLLDPRVRLGN